MAVPCPADTPNDLQQQLSPGSAEVKDQAKATAAVPGEDGSAEPPVRAAAVAGQSGTCRRSGQGPKQSRGTAASHRRAARRRTAGAGRGPPARQPADRGCPHPRRCTPMPRMSGLSRGLRAGLPFRPPPPSGWPAARRVQALLIDRRGNPLHLGRRRRTVSPAQLCALRVRDRDHCVFPGCPQTRRLQAHHVRWWRHGGPHRPGQPRAALHLPPPAGPRPRLPAPPRRTRRVHRRPPGRHADPAAGAPTHGRTEAIREPGIDDRTITPRWGGERLDLALGAGVAAPGRVDQREAASPSTMRCTASRIRVAAAWWASCGPPIGSGTSSPSSGGGTRPRCALASSTSA